MSAKEMVRRESKAPRRMQEEQTLELFIPEVDIVESEAEFRLLADMPGVDEKSVEIDVEKNILTLRGRFVPQPPDGYNLVCQEYRDGDYERSFTLGSAIDRDRIKASVRDGVLRLTLPKAKEEQPRRIEVKAG